MKEKVLKVLKIILMIFGVLFLIQILLYFVLMVGLFNFNSAKAFDFNTDLDKNLTSTKPKELTPIINYVEDYQLKNKQYPEKIENIKLKKGLDYTYETTKDKNCYTITVKEKNTVKQYQHCKTASDKASSTSESYVEYSK